MVDYNLIKKELIDDPDKIGYMPFLQIGDDTTVANLFNTTRNIPIPILWLDKNSLIAAIMPALISLNSKDINTQSKWNRIFDAALSLTGVNPNNPITIGLFQMAMQDQLLTQEQVATATNRSGSKSELLFGPGILVTPNDISNSLPDIIIQKRINEAKAAADLWKQETITSLTTLAKFLIANTVSGKIGNMTPDNKFIPGTDEFSQSIQTAMNAKHQTLDEEDLIPLVHNEMMRIGGGN